MHPDRRLENGNRVTNADLRDALKAATEAIRHEFNANNTATGVQIGAVERVLRERIETLKWRMMVALLGGQVLASIVAALVARITPADAARSALQLLSSLF